MLVKDEQMGKHLREEVFHCNTNFLLQCYASPVKSEQSRHKTETIHRPTSDFHKSGISTLKHIILLLVYISVHFPESYGKHRVCSPAALSENSSEADSLCSFQYTLLTQMGNPDHSSYLANNFMMPQVLGLLQTKVDSRGLDSQPMLIGLN